MAITQNPVIDFTPRPTLLFYLTEGVAVFGCIGDPNGSISANKRALALSDNGNIYYKTTDNAATGWVVVNASSGISGTGTANVLTRWSGATAVENLPNSLSNAAGDVSLNAHLTIGQASIQANHRLFVIQPDGADTLAQLGRFTAQTVTTIEGLVLSHETSAVAGVGFGLDALTTKLESDGGTPRIAFIARNTWTVAADATRTANLLLLLTKNGTSYEGFQLRPDDLALYDGSLTQRVSSGGQIMRLLLKQDTGSGQQAVWNQVYSNNLLDAARFAGHHSRGTNASPTATQSGDVLLYLTGYGQFGTSINNWNPGSEIRTVATENWGASNNGAEMQFYVTKNAGSFTQVAKFHNFGTLCLNSNPTSVNAINKLLINNGIGFASDVYVAIIADSLDTTNALLDVAMGAGSVSNYAIRMSELGDGTLRARLNINGAWEQRVGRANSFARQTGAYKTTATPVANSGTGETTLFSQSVLGNSLRVDTDALRIMGGGRLAANANTKQLRFKFGATTFGDSGAVAQNGGSFTFTAWIIRTGAATQRCIVTVSNTVAGIIGLLAFDNSTTAAETLANAITFAITGQSGTASSDITLDYVLMEYMPAAI